MRRYAFKVVSLAGGALFVAVSLLNDWEAALVGGSILARVDGLRRRNVE